eukprot:TRINITY_DN2277_c0_g1_i2.p1 TRINITY_DN2277_c0_g1~~TRINITY_DN2277_c0_g1_i2.p1  ORF type:complete len:568 (-),score=176.78 TRINITY_DN2277_c0_g1_i2:114-1733(-)
MSELLKQGTRIFQGQEALLKNIEAVKELSMITRTSLGPNGMNKMVINRLGKLFVTNDAATIIAELQVVHPAAKMVQLACEQQQAEYGDAMNLTMVFCGELLSQAESLIRMGLHPSDIIRGFEKAVDKIPELLESLVTETIDEKKDLDKEQVERALYGPIGAKLIGFVDIFTPLVAEACMAVTPEHKILFNVDNVRTAKILGGALSDSSIVNGLIIPRGAEGTIKKVLNGKVAVYADGITTAKTDAKGTVYIETADELEAYAKTEEEAMETKIKEISEAGVNVLVAGGTVHEMAMHFLEKYKIMVVKTTSKFELRRLCQAIKASPLIRIAPPTQEQIGLVDYVAVKELGSTTITVFKQTEDTSQISTILVRGATTNILDDTARALDDGVNVFKAMQGDGRFVPGGGASEIELSRLLTKIGEATVGEDQYAIKKYAEAFEVIPRTLAENAGLDATKIISTLYARHEKGEAKVGVHVQNGEVSETKIIDHLATKLSAISLATNAAVTVLRITQIIMAKRAGVNLPARNAGGTMGSMDTDEHY